MCHGWIFINYFAFGGRDEDNQPFLSVYCFVEETSTTWKEASYMSFLTTASYSALLLYLTIWMEIWLMCLLLEVILVKFPR